jgi:hypothetical protein
MTVPTGQSEDVGDLLVGEILEIGQDDDHPVVVRERFQRLPDIVVQDTREVLRLGIGRLVVVVPADDALEGILDLGEVHAPGLQLLLPVVVDEGVLQDLEEPGLQVRAFLELVVVLVGLEKRLLDQVFRVLGAPASCGRPCCRASRDTASPGSRSPRTCTPDASVLVCTLAFSISLP